MNRRRLNERPSGKPAFIALVLLAVLATTGGAMHAIFRNGQIKTERQIAEVRKRIDEHRLDLQMIEVSRERLLDRYEIRGQLESMDSRLVTVGHGVVEKVLHSGPETAPEVASRP